VGQARHCLGGQAPPYQKLNWCYLGRRTSVYAAPVSFCLACIRYPADIRTLTDFCRNRLPTYKDDVCVRRLVGAESLFVFDSEILRGCSGAFFVRNVKVFAYNWAFACVLGPEPVLEGWFDKLTILSRVEGPKSRILTKSFR